MDEVAEPAPAVPVAAAARLSTDDLRAFMAPPP
jgi:hypothetical protein